MPVKKHLGFKKTQAKIAKKQGISKASAGAILASSARKASPAAVKKNPALKNVPGVKKYNIGGSFARAISGNKTKDTMEKTGYKKIVSSTPATPESRKAFIKKMEGISTSNSGKVTKLTPGQGSGLNKDTSKNIAKSVSKAKNVTKVGKFLRSGSIPNSKLKKSIEVDANASGYKNGLNVNTNEKGRINSVYNRRKGTQYTAFPNGVVAAETKGYSQAIDTTGFSAGKTSFPTTVKKSTALPGGIKAKKVTRYETSRSNVLPTVQKMKKSVMSPTPNVKKQKDLANPKTLSSKSRLMRKGGKK